MKPRLDFISPDSPIPIVVARWLRARLYPSKFGSSSIVLLPTRSAVRIVKSLVLKFAQQDGFDALAGALFLTPEMFISALVGDIKFANAYKSYAALKEAMSGLDKNAQSLFISLKSETDMLAASFELKSLMADLSESALDIQEASKNFIGGFDSQKWEILCELECAYIDSLGSHVSRENKKIVLDCVKNFKRVFGDVQKIYLAGVSDASPLLVRLLDSIEGVEIEAGVIARDDWRGLFDAWGRPTDAWCALPIDSDSNIFSVPDINTQAELVADLLESYKPSTFQAASVCCNEGDSVSALLASLDSVGVDAYAPSGDSLDTSSLMRLLARLRDFYESETFSAAAIILKHPLMLEAMARATGFEADRILEECDKFFESHLPDAFVCVESAEGEARLIFEKLSDILYFECEKISDYFKNLITLLYPNSSEEICELANVELEFLKGQIDEISSSEAEGVSLKLSEAIALILRLANSESFTPEKSAQSIPLLDWIEIFWTPQAHVLICDFNDGIVPQRAGGDSYIPESARTALGMRDSKARHARDAHMLASLIESRKCNGRLSFIVPMRTADGNPAMPSRLLFQCPDSILTQRVKSLFSTSADNRKNLPFAPSWKLKVPYVELGKTLSVSALKAYMQCPFRFYLSNVMRLKTFDENAVELAANGIGTLVHSTLERYIDSPLVNSNDIAKIEVSLLRTFETLVEENYGRDCPAALLLQFYSIKKMFSFVAPKLAELRNEGWRTISTEKALRNLEIENFTITMRVDRIDENANGDLLVIDYKTKSSFIDACSAHVKVKKDGSMEWSDLQLPLYKAAISKIYPDRKIYCAHFTICPTAEDTRLSIWDIDDAQMDSALKKAQEICSLIASRKFDPAEKLPRFENYPMMFEFAADSLNNYLEFENV